MNRSPQYWDLDNCCWVNYDASDLTAGGSAGQGGSARSCARRRLTPGSSAVAGS